MVEDLVDNTFQIAVEDGNEYLDDARLTMNIKDVVEDIGAP